MQRQENQSIQGQESLAFQMISDKQKCQQDPKNIRPFYHDRCIPKERIIFLSPSDVKQQKNEHYQNFSEKKRCFQQNNIEILSDLSQIDVKSNIFLQNLFEDKVLKLRQTQIYNQKIFQYRNHLKQQQMITPSQIIVFDIKMLNEESLSILRHEWKYNQRELLTHINKQYQMYQLNCKDLLKGYLYLFQYKSFYKKSIYERICPGIINIIQSLKQKLQIQNIQTLFQLFINQNYKFNKTINLTELTNIFLQNYQIVNNIRIHHSQIPLNNCILSLIDYLKRNSSSKFKLYLEGQKITSRQFISQFNGFNSGLSNWADLITQLQYQNIQVSRKILINQSRFKYHHQNDISLSQDIQSRDINDNKCLGCNTFYYIGSNISDNSVTNAPVHSFPSIKNLQEYQLQFGKTVCSLLNTGGGIILFDCIRQYGKILPFGIQIIQEQNKKIEQRLLNIISDNIYPNININKMIRIDFVPIGKSPYQHMYQQRQKPPKNKLGAAGTHKFKQKVFYLPRIFATRVRICPLKSSIVYFTQRKQQINCYFRSSDQNINLRGIKLVKFIKKKIKESILQDKNVKQFGCLGITYKNYFQHQCKLPQSFESLNNTIQINNQRQKDLQQIKYFQNHKKQEQESSYNQAPFFEVIIKSNIRR